MQAVVDNVGADMKATFYCLSLAFAIAGISFGQHTTSRQLTQVYQNNDFQLTGISVSRTGRLFVNFPR
jgi:hypothetical protein